MISRLFTQKYADTILGQLMDISSTKRGRFLSFVTLFAAFFLFGLVCSIGFHSGSWGQIFFVFIACCLLAAAVWFVCFLMTHRLGLEQTTCGRLQEQILVLEQQVRHAKEQGELGKIAADVAHDLNNTLSGIGTYPDVLLMDKQLDPKIIQGLCLIRESGKQASAVVRDLLTIASLEKTPRERVNMNIILDAYVRSSEFEALKNRYAGVKVDINTALDLWDINGSYLHIEKVIMNLFFFAMDDLSIKETGWLTLATSNIENPAGKYAVVCFSFNGAAIEKENQQQLFDPFYTKKKMGRGGNGLGLTLVKNVVEHHNGTIDLMSDNRCTSIELFFPVKEE